MGVHEDVANCNEGAVIVESCGELLLAFGDVNKICVIECIDSHREWAALGCAVGDANGL